MAQTGDGRRAGGPMAEREVRREIERTRDRISRDLDAIERKLARERERLRRRLDVLQTARERIRSLPLPALGAAAGVGLLLGLVSARRRARRVQAIATANASD